MNTGKQTQNLYPAKRTYIGILRVSAAVLLVGALFLSLAPAPSGAAAGDLDTTFGSGGIVTTDIANAHNGAAAVVLQPDGRIIAAGGSGKAASDFALVRYEASGSLDSSFGTGGKILTDFGAEDGVNAVALQPDGKIIAAGVTGNYPSYDFALARYNSNGTLDNTFGAGGKVVTPVGGENDEARSVALQTDGKIVAAGLSGNYPNIDIALVRYNQDGSLDSSFGVGGKVLTPVGNMADEANAMIIQPDGKIVAGGWSDAGLGDTYFALARYNPDGSLDNSFGTGGKVTTQIDLAGDYVYALAIQTDNKIVAAGFTSIGPTYDFALARYNTNGTLDDTFGTGGKIITPIGSGDEIATEIAIQSNGKIVAVGWSDGNTTDFAVVRYNSNGSLDNSFGTSGKVLTPIGNSTDFGYAVAIQPDGKIVTAGTSYNGANFDFAVVRYTGDAVAEHRAPFDFDGDDKTEIGIFRPAGGEWWWQRSSDSGITALQFGSASDKQVPADYTGDGRADVAFWRPASGEWFILRSEDFSFYAFPFGTTGDVPVPGDYDGDNKTDAAVFRPSNNIWFIQRSSGGVTIQGFGTSGDQPVVADYDGDNKSDIAIFRPAVSEWWILRSTAGLFAVQFGSNGDKPVPGDYTGDGRADVAFWRPASGEWFILRSEDFSFYAFPWGVTGDAPAPGDYDGDGRFDAAVFRPSDTNWYVQRSTAGTLIQQFGANGDFPLPAAFVP